jgi:hypothetical protein
VRGRAMARSLWVGMKIRVFIEIAFAQGTAF